jgi:hypothetical protein
VFLENFAQTDLDGETAGRTLVMITPGLRFNFGTSERAKMGSSNCVIVGADIPLSDYRPWSATYRFSYIKYF